VTDTVARHRTAMYRTALSRPMMTALNDAIVREGDTIFDYGCGRGGDVRILESLGFRASGWDPAFLPDTPRLEADVVNLGFVINVIERLDERVEALHSAWRLARKVLVVAARLEWEARSLNARAHADGLVTTKGTFQKLYRQDELQAWIDATLGVRAVAAAPGIFYVFRDEEEAQRYLSARVRTRSRYTTPAISEQLYQSNRELFDEIIDFFVARGRIPRETEIPSAAAIRDRIGGIGRAFAVLRRVTGDGRWQQVAEERRRDLLVYLALANFGGRPNFARLPPELQFDVKDLFGSYKVAVSQADKLLYAAGDTAVVDLSARASLVGKLTQEALYVHVSALPRVPAVLRVYEGCGRALTGTVEEGNIIKLHRQKPQVSYLSYPDFDSDPHPALATVVIARLGQLDVTFRDFRDTGNPPILHRKEAFVAEDYPGRPKFERLTAQEERVGVLNLPNIGMRDGWAAALTAAGVATLGHRIVRIAKREGNSRVDSLPGLRG
jgi:DNA phosphorothioation-associated putative methyltransferase